MGILKRTVYKSKRSLFSKIKEKAKHAYERAKEVKGLHESTKKQTKTQLQSRLKKIDKLKQQRSLTPEENRNRLALKIRLLQKEQKKRRRAHTKRKKARKSRR